MSPSAVAREPSPASEAGIDCINPLKGRPTGSRTQVRPGEEQGGLGAQDLHAELPGVDVVGIREVPGGRAENEPACPFQSSAPQPLTSRVTASA